MIGNRPTGNGGPHLRNILGNRTFCGRTDGEALRHAWTRDAAFAGTAVILCDDCKLVERRLIAASSGEIS